MGTIEEIDQLLLMKLRPFERSIEFLSSKYDDLIIRVAQLEKENQSLRDENFSLKNRIKDISQASKNEDNAIKSQMNTLISTLKQLETQLDDLEQYNRRDSLEIKGIPIEEDEDTNEIVREVAKLVDLDIDHNDISISHRLPAGKKWTDQNGRMHDPGPPAIIVKFIRRDDATDLYNSRFKLKGKTTDDLNCISSCVDNNIYISESLNPSRKKLFRSCLKVKKELNFKFISTHNGQIFLKENKFTPSIKISSLKDLANLKSTRSSINGDNSNGD